MKKEITSSERQPIHKDLLPVETIQTLILLFRNESQRIAPLIESPILSIEERFAMGQQLNQELSPLFAFHIDNIAGIFDAMLSEFPAFRFTKQAENPRNTDFVMEYSLRRRDFDFSYFEFKNDETMTFHHYRDNVQMTYIRINKREKSLIFEVKDRETGQEQRLESTVSGNVHEAYTSLRETYAFLQVVYKDIQAVQQTKTVADNIQEFRRFFFQDTHRGEAFNEYLFQEFMTYYCFASGMLESRIKRKPGQEDMSEEERLTEEAYLIQRFLSKVVEKTHAYEYPEHTISAEMEYGPKDWENKKDNFERSEAERLGIPFDEYKNMLNEAFASEEKEQEYREKLDLERYFSEYKLLIMDKRYEELKSFGYLDHEVHRVHFIAGQPFSNPEIHAIPRNNLTMQLLVTQALIKLGYLDGPIAPQINIDDVLLTARHTEIMTATLEAASAIIKWNFSEEVIDMMRSGERVYVNSFPHLTVNEGMYEYFPHHKAFSRKRRNENTEKAKKIHIVEIRALPPYPSDENQLKQRQHRNIYSVKRSHWFYEWAETNRYFYLVVCAVHEVQKPEEERTDQGNQLAAYWIEHDTDLRRLWKKHKIDTARLQRRRVLTRKQAARFDPKRVQTMQYDERLTQIIVVEHDTHQMGDESLAKQARQIMNAFEEKVAAVAVPRRSA